MSFLAVPDVHLLIQLHQGPLTTVFVGRSNAESSPALVIVKALEPDTTPSYEKLERSFSRLSHLRNLQIPEIIPASSLCHYGDRSAILSPFVFGVGLHKVVKAAQRRLPTRVICELMRSTASALNSAFTRCPHDRSKPLNLCHGDLKPSNLLLTRDGALRITDFGLGLTAFSETHSRSTALRVSTPQYLSPERQGGASPSAEDDIYSLGIICLELFRERLFKRLRTQNPEHDRQFADAVAALPSLETRTTADESILVGCLLRMIAHSPDARPTASEVAHTFRGLADRCEGPSLETFARETVPRLLPTIPNSSDARLFDYEVRAWTTPKPLDTQAVNIVETDSKKMLPPPPPPSLSEVEDVKTQSSRLSCLHTIGLLFFGAILGVLGIAGSFTLMIYLITAGTYS